MVKTNLAEATALYNMSYGNQITISKKVILGVLTFICLITPATNWLIPIAFKKAKDISIRYDDGSTRWI